MKKSTRLFAIFVLILSLAFCGCSEEKGSVKGKNKEIQSGEFSVKTDVIDKAIDESKDDVATIELGDIIPGIGDKEYTIEEFAERMDVKIVSTSEVIDELGKVCPMSFDLDKYYITIICTKEEPYYSDKASQEPLLVSKHSPIMVQTNEIREMRLNQSSISLNVGEATRWLSAVIKVSRVAKIDIEWTSSDESVATVSKNDEYSTTVVARKAGKTTITATVRDGGKTLKKTCTVFVYDN